MAQISFTIPDAVMPRIIAAFAGNYGYQDEINGQPNPQTKGQFTKQKIGEFVKENVKAFEANRDAETARKAAVDKAEDEIEVT